MREIVFYYYEPNSINKKFFLTHTERERLFLKNNKTYTIEPITNIKRYFISNKEVIKLFINILKNKSPELIKFYNL